jgi:hypothetical protein
VSGVRRYTYSDGFGFVHSSDTHTHVWNDDTQFVLASDHDRVVAELKTLATQRDAAVTEACARLKTLENERARADAWEQRCRVAVEALQDIKNDTGFVSMFGPEPQFDAEVALAAIGPLPEETKP